MRRFLYKFIILFVLLHGYLAWYAIKVYPNLCGEMDMLGQLPFGAEYVSRMDSVYSHSALYVQNIYTDEISNTESSPIFTIGDSFSAQDILGYQQFLGEIIDEKIYNILHLFDISAEDLFCQLLNSGRIPQGSTVIVESVERSMIERLCKVSLHDTLPNIPVQRFPKESGDGKMDFLNGAAAKLRIMLGVKNPIRQYSTSEDLFTHPDVHNKLYVFNSTWDSYDYGKDGDLLFQQIDDESFIKAYDNLARMKTLADSKNVKFVYLVVADKYEVYEPFIVKDHPSNPTLDRCPSVSWVVNTKPLLQGQAMRGVKDIFRINDTHWSPIGAKLVAEELAKRL